MEVIKEKFGILKVLLMEVINFLIHLKNKISILISSQVYKVNLVQERNLFRMTEKYQTYNN